MYTYVLSFVMPKSQYRQIYSDYCRLLHYINQHTCIHGVNILILYTCLHCCVLLLRHLCCASQGPVSRRE